MDKKYLLIYGFFKNEETCVKIDDITALNAYADLEEAKARGIALSGVVKAIGINDVIFAVMEAEELPPRPICVIYDGKVKENTNMIVIPTADKNSEE